MTPGPPAVALIGVRGYGAVHLERILALQTAGRVRLAALCDRHAPEQTDLPAEVPCFADHRDLLAHTRPDVVVVATPPHTHTPITADALRAGSDVLVEKPPFARLADHDHIQGLARETGRVCQVGFQSLASPALAELLEMIGEGRLGAVRSVTLAGLWTRTDAYYARTAWAGRRTLQGAPVPDGALSNPFAHGVMNVLAVAEAAGADLAAAELPLELERYRARDIEVEDTGCLRLRPAGAPQLLAAVTLCAPAQLPPRLRVTGTLGQAALRYTEDRLQLPTDPHPRQVPGRVSLLENLLQHRADPQQVPLLAPLARVRPFTRLVEAIHASPPPHPIDPKFLAVEGAGPDRRIGIRGVDEVVERAAERAALFSEVGAPWARPATDQDNDPNR